LITFIVFNIANCYIFVNGWLYQPAITIGDRIRSSAATQQQSHPKQEYEQAVCIIQHEGSPF